MYSAFDLPALEAFDESDLERFRVDGFLAVEHVLDGQQIEALRERFEPLFAGRFDTGVYPDEWYWRAELSLPDVTRHMANAWKADRTVAALVTCSDVARAAGRLTGWHTVRLGQDTLWWKPPTAKPVAFHQDTSFTDFLEPPQMVTCWVTLDDTHRDAGTIEYVPGSHRWPVTPIPAGFHAVGGYRNQVEYAAEVAGHPVPEPTPVEVPAGSVVFHAGEIWHGSGPNTTSDRVRRSIGIHLLPGHATFSDRPGGYIYRRYQLHGSKALEESFFPILWGRNGERTSWLGDHRAPEGASHA
jgi:phytanoyl-CoA hydroxylase